MFTESNQERIFTGSAIEVNYLKGILEENGIASLVRNDQESQLRAGFGGSYTNNVLLFVSKQDSMQAKRLTDKALNDNVIPDEVLDAQASESRLNPQKPSKIKAERTFIQKGDIARPKRSMLNIVINIGLIVLSIWRLSPLLRGEELSPLRIAISTGILVFCSWTVFNYFRK